MTISCMDAARHAYEHAVEALAFDQDRRSVGRVIRVARRNIGARFARTLARDSHDFYGLKRRSPSPGAAR